MERREIDGTWYWVDAFDNRWSVLKYTEHMAEALSMALDGCTACTDCISCIECSRCVGCISCNNCNECDECIGCSDCNACTACIEGEFLLLCDGCTVCTNCTDCAYKHQYYGGDA